jgi:predicted MFS family arabinose efflux permease
VSERRGSLVVILVSTMVASTFSIFAISVLASPIIDDFGISRTTVGVIGSVNTGVGALTAPYSGRITDRIGARRAVLAVLVLSAVCMLLMGIAQSPWWLVFAALVAGLPQGWGNPATNALISESLPPGRRGVITGIKQSGVTLAIFVAGLSLPGIARFWSWQAACLTFGVFFVGLAVLSWVLLPAHMPQPTPVGDPADRQRAALPPLISQLGVYALLMGLASGSIGRFLPLFAEEELGYSLSVAGFAAALSGLLGMGFRIGAGRLTETTGAPRAILIQLSTVALVASTLLAISPTAGRWLLWPAVVAYALGHTAWNAVANLAVIMNVPSRDAGQASGIVMMGFLMGLTLAGPVTGAIVDARDDYVMAWWLSAALAATAALVLLLRRSDHGPQGDAGVDGDSR